MAGNAVTLTFAGDATQLQKAMDGVGQASAQLAGKVETSGKKMGGGLDRVSFAAGALVGGMMNVGDAIQGVVDFSKLGATQSMRLARAQVDVEQAVADVDQALGDAQQAQEDYNQAVLDGQQAALDYRQAERDRAQALLDIEQSNIDAVTAQADYSTAVKEHGKTSVEARQAALDLKQAQEDLRQANEDLAQSALDGAQATADERQAHLDGAQATRDGTQATIDAKGAHLDLVESQQAAKEPTWIAQTTEALQLLAPALFIATAATTALSGANFAAAGSWIASKAAIVGSTVATIASTVAQGAAKIATVTWTAVQWLLNAALWANPVGLIVAGVLLLIGVIVLIATKTTWFQTAWSVAWGAIKTAALAVWDWLKGLPDKLGRVFGSIAGFISRPFKAAFNTVSDAWNNTVGSLSWTVPSWVPGIGGASISAPRLPHFHAGGRVPGAPGEEVMAVLQAGEKVSAAGTSGGGGVLRIDSAGNRVDEALLWLLRKAIASKGGNVQAVLGTA